MDAVYGRLNWTMRRAVAVVLCVMAAALLAGGLGGYLIKGTATVVQTRTVQVHAAAPEPAAAASNGAARTAAGYIPGL